MSDAIWIVLGAVGNVDDRSTWIVAAYRGRELAERHADLAQEALIAESPSLVNPYDAAVKYDYTTEYSVAGPCELRDALPEVAP